VEGISEGTSSEEGIVDFLITPNGQEITREQDHQKKKPGVN